MSLEALTPGALFAGRYRVVRALARGGMGAVYEVVHQETQRRRALKVILPGVLGSDEMLRRFQLEAQVAARIESEFVVDVFDAGVDEATQMPFLVMELLRGEDLGARLRRAGRLTAGETVALLHQTALALDRMRAANVVHRDLKPENLFLTEREDGPPRIKVLDLGIAKVLAEGATGQQATRSLGTPLYMAPEQLESESRVTPATDVYALGMIAFTLLVGRAYFAEESYESGNMLAFALAVRRGPTEAPELRAARGGVTLPSAFAPWFARATAQAPERRFPTAVSAVTDLAAALGVAPPTTGGAHFAGLAPSAGAPGALPPAAPPGGTVPALSLTGNATVAGVSAVPALVIAAALLVLGAGVGAGFFALGRRVSAPSSLPEPTAVRSPAASAAADPPPASNVAPVPPPARASAAPADTGAADAGAPLHAPPARSASPASTRGVPLYSRD